MFDFLKKKEKDIWKASFKNLGSAYSYAKMGDIILLQEPDTAFSEPQFKRKLDEATYKFKVSAVHEVVHVEGYWQVELER